VRSKPVQQMILPNVQSIMTGVWRILRAHNLVTLEYTNGSRESGMISTSKWGEIGGQPLAIISEVQAQQKGMQS